MCAFKNKYKLFRLLFYYRYSCLCLLVTFRHSYIYLLMVIILLLNLIYKWVLLAIDCLNLFLGVYSLISVRWWMRYDFICIFHIFAKSIVHLSLIIPWSLFLTIQIVEVVIIPHFQKYQIKEFVIYTLPIST